jgi:hypothetical protein
MRRIDCLVALAALANSPSALAAEKNAAVSAGLPNLNPQDGKFGDPRKYFIFHKPGVTVEQAEADLSFCWRFLPHGMMRRAPDFVPFGKPEPAEAISYSNGGFGLVGSAIGAIIAGPLERSIRQSRMFRCMTPRGYSRYRVSEDVWNRLNSGDAAASIRLQARIAAGTVPPTPRILP